MRDPVAAFHGLVHGGGVHDIVSVGDIIADDFVACFGEDSLDDGADPAFAACEKNTH